MVNVKGLVQFGEGGGRKELRELQMAVEEARRAVQFIKKICLYHHLYPNLSNLNKSENKGAIGSLEKVEDHLIAAKKHERVIVAAARKVEESLRAMRGGHRFSEGVSRIESQIINQGIGFVHVLDRNIGQVKRLISVAKQCLSLIERNSNGRGYNYNPYLAAIERELEVLTTGANNLIAALNADIRMLAHLLQLAKDAENAEK